MLQVAALASIEPHICRISLIADNAFSSLGHSIIDLCTDTTRGIDQMGDLGDNVVTVEKPWGQGTAEQQKHWIMGNDAFNAKAIHHQGIKELWEKKWKFPVCSSNGRSEFSS